MKERWYELWDDIINSGPEILFTIFLLLMLVIIFAPLFFA